MESLGHFAPPFQNPKSKVQNPKLAAALAAVLCMAASAAAQTSLTLNFPDRSTKYVWVQDGYPTSLPANPQAVESMQTQVSVPASTPGARVFVWDKLNGIVAQRQVSTLKADTWDVQSSDFKDIAEVKVGVQYGGNPVASASVALTDGDRTQTQVLDSSAAGVLTFDIVKMGKVGAAVQYRSNGTMATPVNQSFDLSAPKVAVPNLTVAVPGPVETVRAQTPGADGGPAGAAVPPPLNGTSAVPVQPGKDTVSSSPIGSLVVVVIVLVCIAAGGYTFLMWVKKNPDKAKATFEQMGIQVPKPQDADANAGVPNVPLQAPAPPQPVQKIMLGDAGPDPLAGSPTPFVAPAGAISTTPYGGGPAVAAFPQLRSASGDVIPISDAPLVVGRDAGLGLSLVGESTVSRRHAEVVQRGGAAYVKDLGSTNGTFVNGSKVQGEVALRPGDEVQFGAIRFRYEG
jgi:hypothetical protein